MAAVDVVVVSFNSRGHLRACVEYLVGVGDSTVIVVDNASSDRSLEAISDLDVLAIPLRSNGGFAVGCNVGWTAGSAPYVLFLNPDAVVDPASLGHLVSALEADETIGAIGPRILEHDGSTALSQRRFPRPWTSFARALFMHRLFPSASWSDETVHDPVAYREACSPEWVSGACMLVRRSALEQVAGFDEGFFMYCEDKDLCRRLRDAGYDVCYDPRAIAVHEGGASGARSSLLPILAASRIRYAQKHSSALVALGERMAVALEALTHAVVTSGGYAARLGHARAFRYAVFGWSGPSRPAR